MRELLVSQTAHFTPHQTFLVLLMRILQRATGFNPLVPRPIRFTTHRSPIKARPTTTTKQLHAPLATMAVPPKFAAHRMAFGQPVSQNDAVPPTAHTIEIYLDYCVRPQRSFPSYKSTLTHGSAPSPARSSTRSSQPSRPSSAPTPPGRPARSSSSATRSSRGTRSRRSCTRPPWP